jgi:asparagine synthase (glutamine-hydrolysing)
MHTMSSLSPNKEKSPRIPCFAGWMNTEQKQIVSHLAPESVVDGLNTSLELHHYAGADHAVISTERTHTHQSSGLVCQLIGNPRWTTGTLGGIASQQGHSAALSAAYQKHGEQLTKHMRGAYAFVILDPSSATALLGIDRMGRFPLYYWGDENGLLFGTSAHSVLAMRQEPMAVSHQGLYDYVYFHMVPAPVPVFERLLKLQAGCVARFHAGNMSRGRYWQPNFREQTAETRPALYATLREQLKQAVAASLPASGKVGAFLSGGLDSSTVTGMLAELSDSPCDAYSIGFSADGYDEMAFARITAKHFGARLHEYYVTPEDVVEALPLIARSYDEPFGNSSAMPAYFCAKIAAQDGVSLLLAGDGGDEIFAGNERYAKQKVFEAYRHLPALVSKKLLEPLVRNTPAWLPLAKKARSYIDQANISLPDRLQTYNFLHRHVASEMFRPEFLESVDTGYPMALQRQIYNSPEPASSLNRMLFMDWQFTLADNDLRKVNQTCFLAGIEVAYPMLDDDLVEFSTGIPSGWKLPGGKLRDFYKKALDGWLPEATLSKSKQGFGLPFGIWMRSHRPLQEIAYDNILKLKSRDIFHDSYLDNAIAMHRDGHAAYFGELIWILCVLELWMSSHLGKFDTASRNET